MDFQYFWNLDVIEKSALDSVDGKSLGPECLVYSIVLFHTNLLYHVYSVFII